MRCESILDEVDWYGRLDISRTCRLVHVREPAIVTASRCRSSLSPRVMSSRLDQSRTAKGNAGNSFYGLAIGFTVLAAAYSVGGISGGAFNPAVAVGITIMKLSPLSNIWIFFVANFAAAVCAAMAFKAVHPGED